jgi:hypothetical protein
MNRKDTEVQKNEAKKFAIDFLIAEYSALNQEFNRLRGEGMNRLNFMIAITSSVLGGLVFFSQSRNTSVLFQQVVALGALFFLVLIGFDTFRFSISRDISTDKNLRRIGRIRRFFADDFPDIVNHLPWQIHDEPTSWVIKNESGIRQTAQSILSLLFALIVAICISIIVNQPIIYGISSLVTFLIAFFLLGVYANNKYKKALKSAINERKFPNGQLLKKT